MIFTQEGQDTQYESGNPNPGLSHEHKKIRALIAKTSPTWLLGSRLWKAFLIFSGVRRLRGRSIHHLDGSTLKSRVTSYTTVSGSSCSFQSLEFPGSSLRRSWRKHSWKRRV